MKEDLQTLSVPVADSERVQWHAERHNKHIHRNAQLQLCIKDIYRCRDRINVSVLCWKAFSLIDEVETESATDECKFKSSNI